MTTKEFKLKKNKYMRKYYQKNKKRLKKYNNDYMKKYNQNSEHKLKQKEYCKKNKVKISKQQKEYYKENKDKILKQHKEYNNKPGIKKRIKEYQKLYHQSYKKNKK